MVSTGLVWRVGPLRPAADRDPAADLIWAAPFSVRTPEVAIAWGRDSWRGIARVPGPWAVAVADRFADRVIVAHDAVGQVPLFWSRSATGEVLVSTHLASLADQPDVDGSLDPEGVAMRYAGGTGGWDALRRTDFRHIREVPFGHALVVANDGQVSEYKFWDPYDVGPQEQSLTPEDCVEALRGDIDAALSRSVSDLAGQRVATAWTPRLGLPVRLGERLAASGGGIVAAYGKSTQDVASLPFPVVTSVTTPQARERFNALDHHRYPKRGTDVLVAALPEARDAGAAAWLLFDELGVFRLHAAPSAALGVPPARPPWVQRSRHALGSVAATRPVSRTARVLLPGRSSASRKLSRREASRNLEREFPAALAAAREQSERIRAAATSQQLQAAVLMSTETRRHLEATSAIAGALELAVRAPLMDVTLIERALTLPDHAWHADGCTDWAFQRALDAWWPEIPRVPFAGLTPTPESDLPARVWAENDPAMRRVWQALGNRPVVRGVFRDPRYW